MDQRKVLKRNRVFMWVIVVGCLLVSGQAASAADKIPSDVVFEKNIESTNPDNQHLQLNMARPKNGKGPFPGIVCIHGTKDSYVAFEQAVWIIDRLKASSVEAKLMAIKDADHGFRGASKEVRENIEKARIVFFDKHLKQKTKKEFCG